jgi:hypothetical protein
MLAGRIKARLAEGGWQPPRRNRLAEYMGCHSLALEQLKVLLARLWIVAVGMLKV